MKKLVIFFALSFALTACQSAKKQEIAAADPVAAEAGAVDQKAAMADKAAEPAPMTADASAKFPIKTKDGMSFGDKRSIPNKCKVPAEGKQKGLPLTEAMIAGWPPQFFADIAIMNAALAGVAYPEEVAYIQDCMEAKVLEQQVPGPLVAAP
jgi:hypothetical protein